MKTPLICFYKDQWLWSEDYIHLQKPIDVSAENFLSALEKEYFDQIKIIQCDFEAFQRTDQQKIKHYSSPGVQVYVVNDKHLYTEQEIIHRLRSVEPKSESMHFKTLTSPHEFREKVLTIVKDINCGRFYQMNLTAAFKAELKTNPPSLALFNHYVAQFNPTYPAYLPNENFDILSFSPELFLKKHGPKLISRPIKGTSAKGIDDLLQNPKEAAELSMIVDLLRNDLNSVAKTPAIVNVHREKLQLPYTTHTFSEVEVTTNESLPVILKNTMPGGSISGCPKIESLKAIGEFENYQRQFYTGTIGWWEKSDFELNIAIRSFVRSQNQIYYFAGCGIVAESDPESEWNELLNKASKLKLNHT